MKNICRRNTCSTFSSHENLSTSQISRNMRRLHDSNSFRFGMRRMKHFSVSKMSRACLVDVGSFSSNCIIYSLTKWETFKVRRAQSLSIFSFKVLLRITETWSLLQIRLTIEETKRKQTKENILSWEEMRWEQSRHAVVSEDDETRSWVLIFWQWQVWDCSTISKCDFTASADALLIDESHESDKPAVAMWFDAEFGREIIGWLIVDLMWEAFAFTRAVDFSPLPLMLN